MNMSSTRIGARAAAFCGVLCATGCDDQTIRSAFMQHNVSVGQAAPQSTLALASCMRADCGDRALEPTELVESGTMVCGIIETRSITPRWQERFLAATECEEIGPCMRNALRIAVTSNGSVWAAIQDISTEHVTNTAALWLAYHDADGNPLSSKRIDLENNGHDLLSYRYHVDLVVDGRDHLFASVTKRLFMSNGDLARSGWIAEYGTDGEQVGALMPVEGDEVTSHTMLWPVGAGAIALRSNDSIAVLETDRSWRYVQNNAPLLPTTSMVSDASGSITLFTSLIKDPGTPFQTAGSIAHFDAKGSRSWYGDFKLGLEGQTLSSDRAGNLIRTGVRNWTSGSFEGLRELWTQKMLAATGETAWISRVLVPDDYYTPSESENEDGVTGVSSDSAGNLFIGGAGTSQPSADSTESSSQALLLEIAADGRSCSRYEWQAESPPWMFRQVVATPAGELYFAGDDGYGLLER